MPRTKPKDETPTLDDYFKAATNLAALVRQAVDGQVSRKKLLAALERFEKIDYKAM